MLPVKISVIISTCNRANYLKDCLDSLEKQSMNNDLFEVIVVNDGSTDSTGQFLQEFQNNTRINFSFITHENHGVSYSRNVGFESAKGEFIAFTDDDCIVPENWLMQMYNGLISAPGHVVGVGGPLECFTSHPDTFISRFISYVDDFNFIPVLGKILIRHVHVSKLMGNEAIPYLRTSNAMFRKRCLQEVGGFDPNFRRPGGEDPDLCYRLLNMHYGFIFDRDIVVLHHSRDSMRSYFKTLKNYLAGEVRKSRKKSIYTNKVVRRSYEYLLLRKAAVAAFFFLILPFAILKGLVEKKRPFRDAVLFPIIIAASKIFAFAVTLSLFIGNSEELPTANSNPNHCRFWTG